MNNQNDDTAQNDINDIGAGLPEQNAGLGRLVDLGESTDFGKSTTFGRSLTFGDEMTADAFHQEVADLQAMADANHPTVQPQPEVNDTSNTETQAE